MASEQYIKEFWGHRAKSGKWYEAENMITQEIFVQK